MTPQEQQAEELARRLVDTLESKMVVKFLGSRSDAWRESNSETRLRELQEISAKHLAVDIIKQQLPISHWLACEEALRGMSELCDNYFDESGLICARDREIWKQHIQALQSIDNWRKKQVEDEVI